mmetsp:Transcript_9353/g.36381  ORF Transcript_9353/g.36381 Transcript_9353/m.36381 type:complete len:215 (-) Transcript_9353:973-1617(-)
MSSERDENARPANASASTFRALPMDAWDGPFGASTAPNAGMSAGRDVSSEPGRCDAVSRVSRSAAVFVLAPAFVSTRLLTQLLTIRGAHALAAASNVSPCLAHVATMSSSASNTSSLTLSSRSRRRRPSILDAIFSKFDSSVMGDARHAAATVLTAALRIFQLESSSSSLYSSSPYSSSSMSSSASSSSPLFSPPTPSSDSSSSPSSSSSQFGS